MNLTWFAHIDRAKSVPEVISVVRDYFASWTPEELAQLPENCRPPRMRDEEDVASLHSILVDEYRTSRATGNALEALQRLTSFVVRASIRLAELGAPSSGRDEAPDGPERLAASRES